MKKVLIYFGFSLLLVLVFFAGYLYYGIKSVDSAFKPHRELQIIKFSSLDETLYFEINQWGLLGNHSSITLSTEDPNGNGWKYDANRDYKFMCDEIFYKFQKPFTLIIYSKAEPYKPKSFISKVDLVQRVIHSRKEKILITDSLEEGEVNRIGLRL